MTVLIYVDTSKQVGDPEHLKVFANAGAAEALRKTILKAWPLNMRSWREGGRHQRSTFNCGQ